MSWGPRPESATSRARRLEELEIKTAGLTNTVQELEDVRDTLQVQLAEATKKSAEAIATAEASRLVMEEARAEADVSTSTLTAEVREATAAAEAKVADATERADTATQRADEAEMAKEVAEAQRVEAEARAYRADTARKEGEAAAAKSSEQLVRERELLARVRRGPRGCAFVPLFKPRRDASRLTGAMCMRVRALQLAAENMLFVKQLKLSESERERAEQEKLELQTRWRQQTEEWFRKAAVEMQTKLLDDWSLSETLQADSQRKQQELSAAVQSAEASLAAARERIAVLEAELVRTQEARAAGQRQLLAAKEQAGLQQAELAQLGHENSRLRATAEQGGQALASVRAQETHWRAQHEAANARLLAMKEQLLKEQHEASQLREQLRTAEQSAQLSKAVCDRVRQEAAEEHGALLETQARLGMCEEALAAASREKDVLVRSVQSIAT